MMTVSGFTAISRVLGFLRDILIARFLGTGLVGDAFFAAFRFPNMFRRIFGEGAFNAAFVPLFGKKVEQEGKTPALGFANNAFSTLLLVLGVATALIIPCMPWLMAVVVPGFMAKFDRDLGKVGAGPAFYEVTVKTEGAREIYFELEAKSGKTVEHWAERVRLVGMRLVEREEEGFSASMAKVLGSVPEDGKATPVLPGWEAVTGKDKTGAPVRERLEGLQLDGGDYRLEADGRARIPLPKNHHYAAFLVRVEVDASEEDVRRAAFRVYRNHPDTFRLTVLLARIMFGYLLCMALAAHLSGVLNTFKIFAMPAAAPIILNLVFLAGLGLIWWLGWLPGEVLAWSVLIAGVLQCGALWITCLVRQVPVKIVRPRFNGEMRRLFSLMGPGVVSERTKPVISSMVASTSPRSAVSTTECMHRKGSETRALGIPSPTVKMESVSVPVKRPEASCWSGIFFFRATSSRRSTTRGWFAPPCVTVGPPPSVTSPTWARSNPGVSVAWVTSRHRQTSGCSLCVAILAPFPPISSCTAFKQTRSKAGLVLAAFTFFMTCAMMNPPMRLSMARLTMRDLFRSMGPSTYTAGWPTRMPSLATSAADEAPTSTQRSCTCGAFSLPRLSRRKWMAVFPMIPGTSPWSPRIVRRRPRAVAASLPPTRSMRRKPSLVTCLTMYPISSAWASSMTTFFPRPFSRAHAEP